MVIDRAGVEQKLHDLLVAALLGDHDRCEAAAIRGLHLRPRVEQHPRRRHIAGARGQDDIAARGHRHQ